MPAYSSNTWPTGEECPLLSSQTRREPQCNDPGVTSQFGGLEAREELEKNLVRKLDIRMSMLLIIYIVSYVDRTGTAAARLRGFEEDLSLEDSQFASILSVFYVGYITMQVPSNLVLSQIGKPSIYLPCCMVAWGMISFLTGFVTDYHGALLARFLLGFMEATFFPGALYLIARWYKRNELSQRMAFLACGSNISNAFGALAASGILDVMDGVLGYTAWRWLFFVEGGLTVLVAIIAIFILPDYPEVEKISWLTPAEHALAKMRLLEDSATDTFQKFPSSGDESQKGATVGFILALSDWKVWYCAVAQFLCVLSSSYYIYFPTLTATMGYSATISLLLCAPPWVVTAIWALWLARHSDKSSERCMHAVTPHLIGVVGFLLAISTMSTAIRYISLFLMTQTDAGSLCFVAWSSSTVSNPPAQRAVAFALINAVSQSGNIAGSYIWVKAWGPTYNKSYAICAATTFVFVMMCFWMRMTLRRLNREMDLRNETSGEDVDRSGRWRYHI